MVKLGTDPPTDFTTEQYKKLLHLKTNIVHIYHDYNDCPKVLLGLRDDCPLDQNAKPK